MKLIESKVEVIDQLPGLEGVYKQVELAGRTCYKSEDKITEDSAKEFVDRMIKLGHGAMLEHGTVYLKGRAFYGKDGILEVPKNLFPDFFERNKYSIVRKIESEYMCNWYITTNLRVIIENNLTECLEYICEPTEIHEKRITARFTCDMGVGRELTRHSTLSFAQESTRYCNYSKSKFGAELTFICPEWYKKTLENTHAGFERFLEEAQEIYITLLDQGYTAQEARQVLPLALKTEIVVTGFESDWKHFFKLRTSGAAHPDMRKLAINLKEQLYGFDEKTEGCGESSGTNDVTSTAA